MDVIILAGGFGTRLKSISKGVPKPLVPVGDNVFLDFIIKWLKNNNFKKGLISLYYKPDKFKEYINRIKGEFELIPIIETTPLGTGGAIKNVINNYNLSNPFIVLNGDTYNNFDLSKMLSAFYSNNHCIVGITKVEDSFRYGKIRINGDFATSFIEKSSNKSGWINNGCYILKKEIFNDYSNKFSLENDVLPKLIKEKKLKIFHCEGKFIDIGIPEDFHRFCNDKLTKTK